MKPNRFDYVKYDETAVVQQAAFKNVFETIESLANGLIPGRAQGLVFTNLEQAYMWVGKAIRDDQISRNGSAQLQETRTNS